MVIIFLIIFFTQKTFSLSHFHSSVLTKLLIFFKQNGKWKWAFSFEFSYAADFAKLHCSPQWNSLLHCFHVIFLHPKTDKINFFVFFFLLPLFIFQFFFLFSENLHILKLLWNIFLLFYNFFCSIGEFK